MKPHTVSLSDREASPDDQFDVLSDPTRRRLLRTLAARPVVELRDAVSLSPDDADPQQFRIRLFHNHLPKLDDAGFVDWDSDAETIARGPDFEAIEPTLQLVTELQDESSGGPHE